MNTMLRCVVLLSLIAVGSPAAWANGTDCNVITGATIVSERVLYAQASRPEIIVKYRDGTSEAMKRIDATLLGTLRLRPESTGSLLPGVEVFTIEPALGMTQADQITALEALAARLRELPQVEYAHPNYIVGPHVVPNDPCYQLQWHYWPGGSGNMQSPGGIGLPLTWDDNTGAQDVVVSVLDTGLAASHPDFDPANIVPGWDFVDNDSDATDVGPDNGFHGTHVSGTLGVLATNSDSGAASVNWKVGIQPVRVLDGSGSGSFLGVATAIYWAAGGTLSDGNTNPTPAKVINMSLGGEIPCVPKNAQAIIDSIDFAFNQGAVVVVSAGNSGGPASEQTPASCPHTLTVAATDFNGDRSWYSSYGTGVEIAAPGGDTGADLNADGYPDGVLSSVPGGFAFYNGTSMAAPHVAGVAALVFAADPTATPLSVTTRIESTAHPIPSCGSDCGAGLLDASAATAP